MKHPLVDHLPRVYRFALRLAREHFEAEEVVQETFLRAWRARATLRDPATEPAWLLRIAANVWRDRARSRRRAGSDPELAHEPVAPAADPPIESDEEVRLVLRLMDRLPDRQRQVLYLSSVEELGHAEVAEVLGISVEAVKASLSLARKSMRGWIREMKHESNL